MSTHAWYITCLWQYVDVLNAMSFNIWFRQASATQQDLCVYAMRVSDYTCLCVPIFVAIMCAYFEHSIISIISDSELLLQMCVHIRCVWSALYVLNRVTQHVCTSTVAKIELWSKHKIKNPPSLQIQTRIGGANSEVRCLNKNTNFFNTCASKSSVPNSRSDL